jgi:hypothetical protein
MLKLFAVSVRRNVLKNTFCFLKYLILSLLSCPGAWYIYCTEGRHQPGNTVTAVVLYKRDTLYNQVIY